MQAQNTSIDSDRIERAKCFVIQPFGKKESSEGEKIDNDKIFDVIKQIEHRRPSFPILVERADTRGYSDQDLHKHIEKCINEADFCIADITGNNPNVLYEVGLARGLGKELIVICRNRNEVPTDLKSLIFIPYDIKNLDNLPSDIEKHLDRIELSLHYLREQVSKLQAQYFSKRDNNFLKKKIQGAEVSINILHTNLSTFNAYCVSDIIDTMNRKKELELRILTLDPQSIFVNFRALQLKYKDNIQTFRDELKNSLEIVAHELKNFGQRARIKIYDDFPTQISFHIDNYIYICVVSATNRSRENCAFLVNNQMPGAQKSFIEHFDVLWNLKSRDISI